MHKFDAQFVTVLWATIKNRCHQVIPYRNISQQVPSIDSDCSPSLTLNPQCKPDISTFMLNNMEIIELFVYGNSVLIVRAPHCHLRPLLLLQAGRMACGHACFHQHVHKMHAK